MFATEENRDMMKIIYKNHKTAAAVVNRIKIYSKNWTKIFANSDHSRSLATVMVIGLQQK